MGAVKTFGGGTSSKVKLKEVLDPQSVADTGWIYTNDVGGRTELMYQDDTGAEVQLTKTGAINAPATFLALTDTPASYAGAGSRIVRVNAGATALEFLDPATDFLSQYALLAGRAGGQVFVGGTLSAQTLTLRGSAHADGGDVIISPDTAEAVRVVAAATGGYLQTTALSDGQRALRINAGPANTRATALWTRDGAFQLEIGHANAGKVITGAAQGPQFRSYVGEPWSFSLDGVDAVDFTMEVSGSVVKYFAASGNVMQIGTIGAQSLDLLTANGVSVRVMGTGEFLVGRTALLGSTDIAEFQKNQNAATGLRVLNDTSGTAAAALLLARIGGAGDIVGGSVHANSNSYTTSGIEVAGAAIFQGTGTNLSQVNVGTPLAVPLTFWTGNTDRARFLSTGEFLVGRTTLLFSQDVANFEKNQNADTGFFARNSTSNTAAKLTIGAFTGDGATSVQALLRSVSAGFTTSGMNVAGAVLLQGAGTGLTQLNIGSSITNISTIHITFWTLNVERMRILGNANTLQGNAGLTLQGGAGIHTLTLSGGAGAASTISIGATDELIGLYGATAVVQHSTTGQTAGFTAGVGTAVNDDSTFTGGVGTKAYTIGDVVRALKNLGIMASS